MKSFRYSFFLCLIFILSTIFFTGCEHFLDGGKLLDEVQKLIDEANAPEVDIHIVADADTGSVAPNGIVTYKIGKTFPVIFTESKDYQFSHWEVLDWKTKEPLDGVITIADVYANETNFLINSTTQNIYIHPVCIERLAVNNVSPVFAEDGVPRDSSISISFSKDISKDNDLSQIKITSGGNSVKDCYKDPVINNNILTFAADHSNLIDVGTGTKTVTVTIPENFYYLDNKTVVNLGKNYSWQFKVNNSTNSKTVISFSVSENEGKLTPNGINLEYNIGERINLKYEPKENYLFKGWKVLDGDNNPVSNDVLNFENINSSETVVTVLKKIVGVSISPNTVELPKVVSMTPVYSDYGVNCDSSIVIKFNKQMKAIDLESFENIEITDRNNVDITEYYKTPVLNEVDGKTLVIKVNPSKLLVEKNETRTKEIKIKLASQISDAEDGISLEEYYGKDGYINKYCVNNTRESSAPILSEVKIALNPSDINNSDKLFKSYTGIPKYFKQNHISNSFTVSCLASDNNGICKIMVVATPVCSTIGGPVDATPKTLYITPSKINDLGDEQYRCIGTYNGDELKYLSDGIFKFEVFVIDDANNASEASYTYLVAKDTTINSTSWTMENNAFAYGNSISDEDSWPGKTGTTTLTWTINTDLYATYDSVAYETPLSDLQYVLEWGSTTTPFPHKQVLNFADVYNPQTNMFSYEISIDDKYKDTQIKLSVIDAVNNVKTLNVAVPQVDTILYLDNGGAHYTKHIVMEHYIPDGEEYYFRHINLYQHYNNQYVFQELNWTRAKTEAINIDNTADYVYVHSWYEYPSGKMYSSLSDGLDVQAAVNSSNVTSPVCYKQEYSVTDSKKLKVSAILANYESGYDYYLEYIYKPTDESGYLNFGSSFDTFLVKADLQKTTKTLNYLTYNGAKIFDQYNISAEIPLDCNDKNYYLVGFVRIKNGKKSETALLYEDMQQSDGHDYYIGKNRIQRPIFCTADYDVGGPFGEDFMPMTGHIYTMSVYDPVSQLKSASWSNKHLEYTYLWLPYDNTKDQWGQQISPNITLEEYDSYINKASYGSAPREDYIHIEFNTKDLVDGNRYMLYSKIYDEHNNPSVLNGYYIANMASLKNELKYSKDSSKNTIYFDIKDEEVNDSVFYNNIKRLDDSGDYYVITGYDSSKMSWKTNEENYFSESSLNYMTYKSGKYSNSFVRVNRVKSHTVELSDDYLYNIDYTSNPVYIYTGDPTCTCKNIIEGKGGISIICEEPTLFYICSSAIGYGNNQLEWEKRGAHIRPTYTTKSMNVDTSNVTPGDYYVVIAHFADGTSLMSSVYQK